MQQLARHSLGQIGDEVREIVELQAFGGRHQLVGFHVADEFATNTVAELDQHVAFELRIDEIPHHFAPRGWQ